jgi:hypothetical protein
LVGFLGVDFSLFFRRFLTGELLVYLGSVAVDDSFWALFGPVIGRSFRLLWEPI